MPVFNNFFLVNNQINPLLLRNIGPRLIIEIHVPPVLANYLTQRGQPVPAPISGDALLDTGASISAVETNVISQLRVNPIGITSVHTPGGVVQQNLHPIRFVFPAIGMLTIDFNAVIGSNLQPQGIIALVGRDVLSNCLLVYNGPAGMYSISI